MTSGKLAHISGTVGETYIYIWVILLKTGPKCDIEGKNSLCEFFNVIIWK